MEQSYQGKLTSTKQFPLDGKGTKSNLKARFKISNNEHIKIVDASSFKNGKIMAKI